MINKRAILFSVVLLLYCGIKAYGQSIQLKLHGLLDSGATLIEWNVVDTSLLQAFYKGQSENLYWQKPLQANAKQPLLQLIGGSAKYGLNKADYHYNELVALTERQQPSTAIDSIKADIVFSDALLHFLCDIRYGHTPSFEYNGLKSAPDQQDLIRLLQQLVEATDKETFLNSLEPNTKPYKAMKEMLGHFNAVIAAQEFSTDSIVSSTVDLTNKPLLLKLFQLGVLDTTQQVTSKKMVAALKKAQWQLDLLPDGKLGRFTLKALNVSLVQRANAVKATLNDLRWMHRFQNDSLAVVNIPSASLFVYGKSNLIYDSRLVVGKKETFTPTLSSYIHEVILYPYWNVPYSIATEELLPKIKKDRGFLAANNFQVLSKQGKVLNADSINWNRLNATNFPYQIRQSTGCDNSLGIVKFNFPNPFAVYLHDTPSKSLFARKKRYFSHGCMRMEHPIELAELLLHKEKAKVKKLTEKCLNDQKPSIFTLKKPMPIAVLYNTAWYDTKGTVVFYDDVYGN